MSRDIYNPVEYRDCKWSIIHQDGEVYYKFKKNNGDVVLIKFDEVMKGYLNSLETGEEESKDVEIRQKGFVVVIQAGVRGVRRGIGLLSKGILVDKIVDIVKEYLL